MQTSPTARVYAHNHTIFFFSRVSHSRNYLESGGRCWSETIFFSYLPSHFCLSFCFVACRKKKRKKSGLYAYTRPWKNGTDVWSVMCPEAHTSPYMPWRNEAICSTLSIFLSSSSLADETAKRGNIERKKLTKSSNGKDSEERCVEHGNGIEEYRFGRRGSRVRDVTGCQ